MTKAFTLAEVLITLAIIGVVAAMTIPTLTANYKKKVTETRIKKFYSILSQVVAARTAEYGDLDYSMITVPDSADEALEFFNENYKPYIKTADITMRNKGIAVGLPDGSGMYIRRTGQLFSSVVNMPAVVFCVNYKYCKTNAALDGTATLSNRPNTDGKNAFVFWPTATIETWHTRATLKNWCSTGTADLHFWCLQLIAADLWEIKDDYPVRF